MRRRALALAAALAALFAAEATHAHGRSRSFSSLELAPGSAQVRLHVLRLDLLPLLGAELPEEVAAAHLAEWLRLADEVGPCPPDASPLALAAPVGWAAFEWRVACPGREGPRLDASALFARSPAHLHFARAAGPAGVVERVLSESEPVWTLAAVEGGPAPGAGSAGTSLGGYVALGIGHILSGWDHLAFVLALLLLAATVGEVAGLVTAFTAAHSTTLVLAVLGWLRPDPGAVEALIGFSIALVAAENAWLLGGRDRLVPAVATGALVALALAAAAGAGGLSPGVLAGLALFTACHFGLLARARRPARLRAAVAFAFGLVHGFGFAGVLAELALPRARLAPALFGFNAGVELGQLAVVAAVWPLLRGLAGWRSGRPHAALAQAGSAAICGLGVFWFASRAFG